MFWRRLIRAENFLSLLIRRMVEPITTMEKWPPIVVVLGATASGKSKLAIDLASKYGGEVISADSMQVYKGLDLLTNKVTDEESKGVPHYMISTVEPTIKFDVQNYSEMALPILEKLLAEKKMPIIVGGTNYYIESLLWKILVKKSNEDEEEHSPTEKEPIAKRLKIDLYNIRSENSQTANILEIVGRLSKDMTNEELLSHLTNEELHDTLVQVDSMRANKLHTNERRKVVRSLQIFVQTGRPHSDWIEDQLREGKSSKVDGNERIIETSISPLGGSLRFHNVLCLWIDAPLDLLRKRIDGRVDDMVKHGLRDELHEYYENWIKGVLSSIAYTKGQLQSIGYKEFKDYLSLEPDARWTKEGEKRFEEGVAALKLITRQYAKKQLKWIQQRFLRPSRREVPPVYRLDGTSTAKADWERNVTQVACKIIEAYIDGSNDQRILVESLAPLEEKAVEDDMKRRVCEVCANRVLMGTVQWELHLKSSKHRKMLKRKDKIVTESEPVKIESQV